MKTERLYIRLTPELKAQLQKTAQEEHRTVSNYIEYLVKQALKEKIVYTDDRNVF